MCVCVCDCVYVYEMHERSGYVWCLFSGSSVKCPYRKVGDRFECQYGGGGCCMGGRDPGDITGRPSGTAPNTGGRSGPCS